MISRNLIKVIVLFFVIFSLYNGAVVNQLFTTKFSTYRNLENSSNFSKPVATIAYHLVFSQCKNHFRDGLRDDLTVLRHSIHLNSYPLHPTSQYAAKIYAIVPLQMGNNFCMNVLKEENVTIRILPTPPEPQEINEPFRSSIGSNGCCGTREFLKLHAYNVDPEVHPISLNIDFDTLVIKPFDTLFDVMLYDDPKDDRYMLARKRLVEEGYVAPTYFHNHREEPEEKVSLLNKTFQAFYTKDYNMIRPGWQEKRVGMQGGFLMVKPNKTIFDELVNIVKEGDYLKGRGLDKGWKGSGYGNHIWGSKTIQGLLGYYFNKNWETSVELNRCMVNQIGDNPRRSTFGKAMGQWPRGTPLHPENATWKDTTCRDGREKCDDVQCQNWPIEKTIFVHFTYCGKPRQCKFQKEEDYLLLHEYACTDMSREWFRTRRSLEMSRGEKGFVPTEENYAYNYSFGYCKEKNLYIPIEP